jgi:alpha-beta hydrolase superfamily lysophospholipase
MSREDFSFRSGDGLEIVCYRWPAGKPARAVVQISHGMGEHALRYAPFAAFLNDAGIQVYANDHRGHGRTAKSKEALGDLGAGGWNALVADMASLTKLARERERGLPLVVLGHSMGSFALQQYLLDHSALIAGAIISGSVALDMLPQQSASDDVDLTAFNAGIQSPRTPFDWLSHDPAEVDKYIADPLCGFGINARSRATFAEGLRRAVDPAELARIRKDLPIYIVAGDEDPINFHLEALKPLAERYRTAGIRDVTERYYRGGRHEMLNEINRDEVMRDLLGWVERVIGS